MSVVTRRSFLSMGAAAAAALTLGPSCVSTPTRLGRKIPAERRLRVACIGCGGRGAEAVAAVSGEQVVALCDVDYPRAAASFRRLPDAPRYHDYRHLLKDHDEDLDAVVIATPDHMHAPIALDAMRRGKHVFIEPPLAHTVAEARWLAEEAHVRQVVTQLGIQGTASDTRRTLMTWLKQDVIGPVHEVHLWTSQPSWPQGMERPRESPLVPSTLAWDLWLGVAPPRPYHPRYHPAGWRAWWDFGTGALGAVGSHFLDAAFVGLELGSPSWVEAETSPKFQETAPVWSVVTYQFPARGARPPVKLVWYEGGRKPPRPAELEADRSLPDNGEYYVGERGVILVANGIPRLVPDRLMREQLPLLPRSDWPESPGIYQEWIRACKGGPAPLAPFHPMAGPMTEALLAGNLAVRIRSRVNLDLPRLRCPKNSNARDLLFPNYDRETLRART